MERGEMMMGYPTGPANTIPKLPILSTHEEMVHKINIHQCVNFKATNKRNITFGST
jgi:hypothetical protein